MAIAGEFRVFECFLERAGVYTEDLACARQDLAGQRVERSPFVEVFLYHGKHDETLRGQLAVALDVVYGLFADGD